MSWQLPPDVYQGFYTQGLCHVKQKKQKRKKQRGGDGWTLAGEPSLHLPSPPPPLLPPLSWLSRVILDWVATGSPEKVVFCFFLCIWKKNKQITFGCCLKGSPDLIHPLEEKVFCQRRNCTFRNKTCTVVEEERQGNVCYAVCVVPWIKPLCLDWIQYRPLALYQHGRHLHTEKWLN